MDIIEILSIIGLIIATGLIIYLIWAVSQEVVPSINSGSVEYTKTTFSDTYSGSELSPNSYRNGVIYSSNQVVYEHKNAAGANKPCPVIGIPPIQLGQCSNPGGNGFWAQQTIIPSYNTPQNTTGIDLPDNGDITQILWCNGNLFATRSSTGPNINSSIDNTWTAWSNPTCGVIVPNP